MQNKEIEKDINILIEESPTYKKEDALYNIKQYIDQLETKVNKYDNLLKNIKEIITA